MVSPGVGALTLTTVSNQCSSSQNIVGEKSPKTPLDREKTNPNLPNLKT